MSARLRKLDDGELTHLRHVSDRFVPGDALTVGLGNCRPSGWHSIVAVVAEDSTPVSCLSCLLRQEVPYTGPADADTVIGQTWADSLDV